MPLYEMRWMFKDIALKFMAEQPPDSEPPAREIIESFGGKLHRSLFMSGEQEAP